MKNIVTLQQYYFYSKSCKIFSSKIVYTLVYLGFEDGLKCLIGLNWLKRHKKALKIEEKINVNLFVFPKLMALS